MYCKSEVKKTSPGGHVTPGARRLVPVLEKERLFFSPCSRQVARIRLLQRLLLLRLDLLRLNLLLLLQGLRLLELLALVGLHEVHVHTLACLESDGAGLRLLLAVLIP